MSLNKYFLMEIKYQNNRNNSWQDKSIIRILKMLFLGNIILLMLSCKGTHKTKYFHQTINGHQKKSSSLTHGLDSMARFQIYLKSFDNLRKKIYKHTFNNNGKGFSHSVDFNGSKFLKGVDFKRVNFANGASFDKVSFFKHTFFYDLSFFNKNGIASFVGTKFHDLAFSHVNFFCETKFSEAKFYPAPKSSIIYGEAFTGFFADRFHKDVYFDDANFDGSVSFEQVKFNGNSYFDRAIFKNDASYEFIKFSKTTTFGGAIFGDEIRFVLDTFVNEAYFIDTRFKKFVGYTNCIFLKNADWQTVDQSRMVDTGNKTIFYNNVSFERVKFLDSVKFDNVVFNSTVNFLQSDFSNYGSFSGIVVGKNTKFNFTNSTLPDTINLSGISNVVNEIDFTTANFTNPSHFDSTGDKPYKPHEIFLLNSDLSKIHLDYEHFKLSFRKNDGHELNEDQKESIYEALLKNFSDRGQKESYKKLDLEYQKFKWYHSTLWFLGWVPHIWWNYGYNKELVFLWTFGLLILFTILNYSMLGYLNTQVYKLNNFPVRRDILFTSTPAKKDVMNRFVRIKKRKLKSFSLRPFLIRFWFSLVYTSTIFFLLSLKLENINFKNRRGTAYVFFIYTIGILCLAYMANFVLQK